MNIYIDYIFLINFIFDFILLLGISLILKRNIKIKRIILGSLLGSFSIVILFLNISSFLFFILKLSFGLLMVIVTFKYKDFKYTFNNFFYLIILSIIVGGFLYLINIEIGYDHIGMLFFTNGKSLNILILILLAFLIVIIYVKKIKHDRIKISCYYKVTIFSNNHEYYLNGYLDTGNNLFDPYLNRPILIVNSNINILYSKFIFVPFETLNSKGLLKCYFVDKIFIEGIGYKKNILIGKSFDKFKLSGVDIILNKGVMEDI